jgi:hypothetical protein
MAPILTFPQISNNAARSETGTDPYLQPLPPDPRLVLLSKSTADHQRTGSPADSVLWAAATVSRYLAQSPEDLRKPTVFQFVLPNQITADSTYAGAGSIPESSIILQKWEGVVLERGETKFSGYLYEGNEDFPLKCAEIDLEELAVEDRDLVTPGAPFVWTIGYRVRRGTRSRFSEIYFRRLPRWTKEEIDSAKTAGAALSEDAGWTES